MQESHLFDTQRLIRGSIVIRLQPVLLEKAAEHWLLLIQKVLGKKHNLVRHPEAVKTCARLGSHLPPIATYGAGLASYRRTRPSSRHMPSSKVMFIYAESSSCHYDIQQQPADIDIATTCIVGRDVLEILLACARLQPLSCFRAAPYQRQAPVGNYVSAMVDPRPRVSTPRLVPQIREPEHKLCKHSRSCQLSPGWPRTLR